MNNPSPTQQTVPSTYNFDPFHGFHEGSGSNTLSPEQGLNALECISSSLARHAYNGVTLSSFDYLSWDICVYRLLLWEHGIPSRPQYFQNDFACSPLTHGKLILGTWDRREIANAIWSALWVIHPIKHALLHPWPKGMKERLVGLREELLSMTHAVADGMTYVAIDLLLEVGCSPLEHLKVLHNSTIITERNT